MAVVERKRGARRRKVLTIVEPENNLSSVAQDMTTPTEEGVSIRSVRQTIEEAFNALGTDQLPGSVIPTGQKNNSREAADFVVAHLLDKLASERLKKASEAAEKAGVFGDKENYITGDTVMVYNDPNFSISVKMGKPSRMIGREEVEAAAVKYLGKKADDFLDECKKDRSATKQIIVSMK